MDAPTTTSQRTTDCQAVSAILAATKRQAAEKQQATNAIQATAERKAAEEKRIAVAIRAAAERKASEEKRIAAAILAAAKRQAIVQRQIDAIIQAATERQAAVQRQIDAITAQITTAQASDVPSLLDRIRELNKKRYLEEARRAVDEHRATLQRQIAAICEAFGIPNETEAIYRAAAALLASGSSQMNIHFLESAARQSERLDALLPGSTEFQSHLWDELVLAGFEEQAEEQPNPSSAGNQ